MKTEFSSAFVPPVSGEVIVPQIAPDTELQLFTQKATTPPAPTAHTLPPEVAKVTELSPTSEGTPVGVTWFGGICVHTGEESSDVPCKISGTPDASASPTAQASDELRRTIERNVVPGFEHGPGENGAVHVFPSVVLTIVHEAPTPQPFVSDDIATPLRFTPVGLGSAVQTPPTNRNIVPPFPTAIPSSPVQGLPEQ